MKHNPFSIYNSSFSKKSRTSSLAWEESINGSSEDPEDYYEGHSSGSSSLAFLGVLILIFSILGVRLVYLQLHKGSYYRALAEGNHIRNQSVLAPRGIIYDSQGETIVENAPSFDLVVVPADIVKDKFDQQLQALADLFHFDINDAKKDINKNGVADFQGISIVSGLSRDEAVVFESQAKDYQGFHIEDGPIRQYKDPLVFAHVIGYTGKINENELSEHNDYALNDYIGKTGVEYSYEKYLKGVNGKKQIEVDASGTAKSTLGEIAAESGKSLTLNIDAGLQRELYNEIIAKNGNKKAAAVAIDPRSGQVLALLSLPGYDDNLFAKGISQNNYSALSNDPQKPLLNRAISGAYPPGSTIKPVMASAALQENIVQPDTKIVDNGDLVYGGYHFRGWKPGGLGPMDVRSAIAMSSDIYFYTVGGGQASLNIQGLGPDRIAKYDSLFGMGQKLGIDLPNEVSGLVADPAWKRNYFKDTSLQTWYPGDTYHVSIGQGDMLATPLQVAMWTSVVANGGTLYKPYIVNKVADANGKVVMQNDPQIIRAGFIDPKNIQIVREGMRQTVTSGTARSLNTLPVTAAGKTGTAQFDGSNPAATHAWFTAFAPYENPKIVITVLIEAGGEGSSAASPVVKNVLNWWATNRNK
jgi:penicillin-binding protein 2